MNYGWLEISTQNGGAGITTISAHTITPNDDYGKRSITFEIKGYDDITYATITISQEGKDITIVSYNDTVITNNNTAIGYGDNS